MKKLILFLSSWAVLGSAYGQTITLQEVLQEAKSAKVSQANSQVILDQLKVATLQAKRLPLVYGDANVQRNLIVPVTPVPAIAFNPNAAEGEIMPLRFATNWSAKAGIQMSFDLLNVETAGALKEATIQQQKSVLQKEAEARNLTATVISLYADVILAQEQLAVAEQLYIDYKQVLTTIKARYESGRALATEYNNALKKDIELEQYIHEARLVLLNKKVALIPYLSLQATQSFSTPMEDLLQQASVGVSTLDSDLLKVDQEINQLQRSNLSKLALPKLTLNGYLGTQYFNNRLRLWDTSNWFGTSFVNMALRLPITEAFERRIAQKQLATEQQLLSDKLEEVTRQDEVKQQQRENQMAILQNKLTSQEKVLQLLDANVSIARSKVEEGTALITVLNQEIESYLNQKKQIWQTQHDLVQKLLE